jgi:hypothetical protein
MSTTSWRRIGEWRYSSTHSLTLRGRLHAPAVFPQGKSPWYPLDRRLGWPQSRSGRGGDEKNSQILSKDTRYIFIAVSRTAFKPIKWGGGGGAFSKGIWGQKVNSPPSSGEVLNAYSFASMHPTDLHNVVLRYLLTYLLHGVEYSLKSWWSLSLSNNSLFSLWKPKFHYRVHKSPPLDSILSQPNQVMSFFHCLGRAKESVRVRGALKHFVTHYFFTVRSC